MQYQVTWTIEIEADSSEQAAKEALEIMQDKGSEALNFDVKLLKTGEITNVDLLEIDLES